MANSYNCSSSRIITLKRLQNWVQLTFLTKPWLNLVFKEISKRKDIFIRQRKIISTSFTIQGFPKTNSSMPIMTRSLFVWGLRICSATFMSMERPLLFNKSKSSLFFSRSKIYAATISSTKSLNIFSKVMTCQTWTTI